MVKQTIVLDLGYSNLDNCNLSCKVEELGFKTAVLRTLQDLLCSDGYRVVITDLEQNDNFKSGSWAQKAQSERADLYISIDTGYSSNSQVRGHWVFYWYDCDKGKELAQIWNRHALHALPHPSKGVRASRPGEWTDFSHVRKPTQYNIPTILIKHGYLTNSSDFELLKTPEFQDTCAEVLFLTVKEYFNDENIATDWRIRIGEKALGYLVDERLITSKEEFSKNLLEPLPGWVVWEMFKRLSQR